MGGQLKWKVNIEAMNESEDTVLTGQMSIRERRFSKRFDDFIMTDGVANGRMGNHV